jgi:phospholipid/cholesterol/gamma-HCH transport system permease protein
MKTNQEVDALKVMGSNPFIILVLPRLLALLIALPLLTLIADILALLAAAAIAPFLLDISFSQFFMRVQYGVGLSTFLAGLIKAPFFALVIAWIGCWQGMQVTGSSESLGEHTTSAVVQSTLLVLLLDALFSILFYQLGF